MTYDYEDGLVQELHDLENKIDELEFERQEYKAAAEFWQKEYDKLRQSLEKLTS